MQKRLKNIVIIIAVITVAFIILLILTNQKKNDNIEVRGIIEMPFFSWTPDFDRECIGPPLIIVINSSENEYYWLTGTCPFNPTELNGKEVIVTGILEKREIDVPLSKEKNASAKKEIFKVINVTNIDIVTQ